MNKKFAKSAAEIKTLLPDRTGCIASDRITVNGLRVGYMFRSKPRHAADSGWGFFSGEEPEGFNENPDNFGVYAVNTIANYDPEIIPLLDSPVGSAFIRDPDQNHKFVPDQMPDGWD